MKVQLKVASLLVAAVCATFVGASKEQTIWPVAPPAEFTAEDSHGWVLAEIGGAGKFEWRKEKELIRSGTRFIDVTNHVHRLGRSAPDAASFSLGAAPPQKFPVPTVLRHASEITAINALLQEDRMRKDLEQFTTRFHTRYYKSRTGLQSAEWLFAQVSEAASGLNDGVANRTGDIRKITVRKFEHADWPQFSIIASIEGSASDSHPERVIIGSHQDSVNSMFPYLRSPGADDDGSGTMTTLEAFRALVQSGFAPQRTVEFHFASGEEAGLKGSMDIAKHYAESGIPVAGMLQNDMTGYYAPDAAPVMGIVTDFVDPELTELLRKLVDKYTDARVSRVETKCGYACSDHGSWNRYGYRSVFPFENDFKKTSPYIHTREDTIEHIRFDYMLEFAKLSVGFAVELSDPSLDAVPPKRTEETQKQRVYEF